MELKNKNKMQNSVRHFKSKESSLVINVKGLKGDLVSVKRYANNFVFYYKRF